ncbi:hypothetical protein [Streptomyces sp. DT203]|uniref:hypothetical protein n=1 Tax=Streptomyces sp. DT203 TaxID=3393424 RepID=UPI003CEC59AF
MPGSRRAADLGSLHLFSPAAFSSLPGWLMPAQAGEEDPDTAYVLSYLRAYENRYDLPVQRSVRVAGVLPDGEPHPYGWRSGSDRAFGIRLTASPRHRLADIGGH